VSMGIGIPPGPAQPAAKEKRAAAIMVLIVPLFIVHLLPRDFAACLSSKTGGLPTETGRILCFLLIIAFVFRLLYS